MLTLKTNTPWVKMVNDKTQKIFDRAGILIHTSGEDCKEAFKGALAFGELQGYGHTEEVLSILENVDNLQNPNTLLTNFNRSFKDLYPKGLENNKLFEHCFKTVLNFKGKGVGVGELAMPFLFRDYRFSNVNDGVFTNDSNEYRTELKNGKSASLKINKKGAKGVAEVQVDKIVEKYLGGTRPCMKQPSEVDAFKAFITKNGPQCLIDAYTELYPYKDISELTTEILNGAWKDTDRLRLAVGRFALKEYQKIDGWDTLMVVRTDKMILVNIADIFDIDSLGLEFTPKMKRGGDTQAVPDGYVNISIQ